jgi:hypothetical protein
MATVPYAPAARKPRKAYYAWLDDDHGVLTQDEAGQIWFRNSVTQALIAITPEHCNFLTVNGECGLADAALAADLRHHGYAAIACHRAMEIA